MSDESIGEEFFDNLLNEQENLDPDPDATDVWDHEDDEINDERSLSSPSTDADLEVDGMYCLFSQRRDNESSDEESTGGVLSTLKRMPSKIILPPPPPWN
jgi:hypothetical protein